ncbi:MAG: putative Ig domain-containing protein, partial [Bacteroidota bacterium]
MMKLARALLRDLLNIGRFQFGLGLALQIAILLTVSVSTAKTQTNHAPTLSAIANVVVDAGQLVSFTPTAADIDGDTLSFSIQTTPQASTGLPPGATFSAVSGAFYWQTSVSQTAYTQNFRITVSDGSRSASRNFTITVRALSSTTTTTTTTTTSTT